MKVMNTLFKYKWIVLLIILTLIKVILCSLLPMFYLERMTYDDHLMMTLTENISNGNWLGDYNNFTLIKGPFFPLLLSFFRFIHLPTGIGISLIYVLACATFCYIIRDQFNNKKILYILYILLLFNPISMASETFERLYRYAIGPAQVLFFLAFLYGIYKNLGKTKQMLPHLIGLGLTVSTIILTREDYLFITVLLIICFGLFIIKLKQKSFVLLLAIIVMIIPIYTIKAINNHYYGKYIINELTEISFKEAYLNILSIKPEENIYRVSIPKSTIYKLLEISPTFKTLSNGIENLYLENDEIIDGYMIWYLRAIQASSNLNQTLQQADNFWSKVNDEINTAFKEGKLEKRFVFPSVYMSPPTPNNIILAIKRLPKTIKYVLTYDEVMTFDYQNLKSQSKTMIFDLPESYSNYSEYYSVLLDNDLENTAQIGTLSYNGVGGVCNTITLVYKGLSIIINVFGILSFIVLILKRQTSHLFLPNIIFICLSLIILGITYTDASAFDAIRYYYLAPVYSLLIAFSIISINILIRGIKNGEIRFNNINAMSK